MAPKNPKSGSRMAQTRYDFASGREDALTKKGWSGSYNSPEYQAYLAAVKARVSAAAGLKSKPTGSGKKK